MQPLAVTPVRRGRWAGAVPPGVFLLGIAVAALVAWDAGVTLQRAGIAESRLPWLIFAVGFACAAAGAILAERLRRKGEQPRPDALVRRLAQVAMQTTASVLITGLDGRIEWVNESFTRLFGFTAEDAVGRYASELFRGSETRPEAVEAIEQARREGRAWRAEIVNHAKDGRPRWIEIDLQPLRDEAGIVTGSVSLHLDVTARRQFQEELERKERQFRFIFEAAPVGFCWRHTRPDGTRQFLVNEAHGRITGLSREESERPGAFAEIGHPDDVAAQEKLTARLVAGEIGHFSLEKRYQRTDGTTVWVVLTRQRMGYPDGTFEELTTVVDITELKRAQAVMAAHEARFRFIFELVPVGLSWFQVGRQQETHLVNSAHARITGVPLERSGESDAYNLATHPEDQARQQQLTARLHRGETDHFTLEKRYLHPDGSIVWVVLTVRLFRDPVMNLTQQVATLVDVTELKHQAEELRTAMETAERASLAKSQFLAMMSHEIRTPMNGVIGMTSLLLDSPLSGEQQDYVETIRESGDSLLRIINDVLDFSKIESGRLEFECAEFGLRECIEGTLDLMASKVTEKNLDLLYEIADSVPGTVQGDATRLRQILVNLLGNAVKFTEKGEIVLGVRAAPRADDRLELAFSVSDTGIGIPPEGIQRLFQSFSQVDASTTRRFGGTGLGLAISKRLAELMGGTMWVESELGRGSTFHFTIVVDPVASKPRAFLPAGRAHLAGRRLLLVDDNATNRRILSTLVAGWGLTAVAAATGAEALALLQNSEHFDAAILDMQMPGMDGAMLAREIRRQRSAEDLPLILLSSLGQRDLVPEPGHFAAYLTKPAKPAQILDALAEVLKPDRFARRASTHPFQPPPAIVTAARRTDRILLAEDNAVNQRVALLMLGRLGCRADLATDGNEVLELTRRQRYDVILMDVQMPGMDGLAATRALVERWPGRPDRPWIVALTANAMAGDREKCLAAGMDDYVSKPLRVEELAEALDRARAAREGAVDGRSGAG